MNRKQKLISEKLSELLIRQLAHELENFNLYKTFANYYATEGVEDLAKYFNIRADEELEHQSWIFNYLTDGDIRFEYPNIKATTVKVKNLLEPFQLTLEKEIETTNMIYEIYEAAQAEKDHMTVIWLQEPLLLEQIEEENSSRAALCIMEQDADIYMKAKRILNTLEG